MAAAWALMRDVEIDTLCITDPTNEMLGLISVKDIATANMDLFDTAVLAAANTRCSNLLETLEAELVVGNADARIFTTCLDPQLIAIDGIYRTIDTALPDNVAGKPAQIRRVGHRLLIDPL